MTNGPRIEEIEPANRSDSRNGAEPPRHVAGERLGGIPPLLLRSAFVVAVLLALAVAKPWSGRGATTPSAAPALEAAQALGAASVGGSPARTAIDAPPALPPDALACGAPDGWRLVTVDRLAGKPGDSLTVVEPVADASGPEDPRIVVLRAGQAPLVAIGACRPLTSPGVTDDRSTRPPALVVGAWQVGPSGISRVDIAAKGYATKTAGAAQLYGPIGGGSWGPGRYVLEIATGDLSSTAWMSFEVTAAPSSAGSPSPGP